MKYNDLDYAVKAYLKVAKKDSTCGDPLRGGNNDDTEGDAEQIVVYSGKSDVQSAFRLALL